MEVQNVVMTRGCIRCGDDKGLHNAVIIGKARVWRVIVAAVWGAIAATHMPQLLGSCLIPDSPPGEGELSSSRSALQTPSLPPPPAAAP